MSEDADADRVQRRSDGLTLVPLEPPSVVLESNEWALLEVEDWVFRDAHDVKAPRRTRLQDPWYRRAR